jgi:hypothetical protein
VICTGEPTVFRFEQFAPAQSERVPAAAPPDKLNALTVMPTAAALTVMV